MPSKYLWNKDKTASVVASKLRTISIYQRDNGCEVEGWYNANEYFYFGMFNNLAEAQEFVTNLHKES
jgi:hypothetical protein